METFGGSAADEAVEVVAPAVSPKHRLALLALLGALSAFGPLSMDMYLPPTPTIAANLQGMAGAVGVVLSLAMVRDMYEGTEFARVLGSLMLVFGLAPVLAPVIGGQVLRFTSWRGVFGVLAAIGLVLLVASWFLPETLPPQRRQRSRLRQLSADSRTLTRDRQYTANVLAVALGNAAPAARGPARPALLLLRGGLWHDAPERDRAGAGTPGRHRRHGVGLAGRAALPARGAALPAGILAGPAHRRARGDDGGRPLDRHALRRRAGRPSAHIFHGVTSGSPRTGRMDEYDC